MTEKYIKKNNQVLIIILGTGLILTLGVIVWFFGKEKKDPFLGQVNSFGQEQVSKQNDLVVEAPESEIVELAPEQKVFDTGEIYGVGIIVGQDVSAQKINDFFSFYNSITYNILIDEGTEDERLIRVIETSLSKRAEIRLFYISYRNIIVDSYASLILSEPMPKNQMENRLKQLMMEQGISIGTIIDLSKPIPDSFNF